jgi:hypothetical protein
LVEGEDEAELETGLPGKFPETRPVTVVFAAISATLMIATVMLYFAFDSSIHLRMARRPRIS